MTDQAFLVNPAENQPRETITTKAAANPAFTKSPGKAPGAYRTISEASDELGVPQHVLRFWETKFSQIRPMKRSGGRRFYRPEDIELIRTIQTLLYDQGYTIKGVQRLLKLRRGLQGAQAAMEAIEDAPAPLFDAVAPEPITVKPVIERAEQEVRAAATEVLAQLTDELTEMADAAEGNAQAAYDLFTNTPVDILEQIPDHLPAKPARLMATGLAAGHPLPTMLAAELAEEIAANQPQAQAMPVEPAAQSLSPQQRQQIGALLEELKALKTLLN